MTALATPPFVSPRISAPPAADALDLFTRLRPFSGEEYDRMVEVGILSERDDVELIDGYVVVKMSREEPHDYPVELLSTLLIRTLPPLWRVRIQLALSLGRGRPEPDIAIVRAAPTVVRPPRPTAVETVVAIEVADSSLDFDRGRKLRAYARAGIPVYWVVNVPDRQVEVYTEPTGPATEPEYAHRELFPAGTVVSLILDGEVVATVPVTAVLLPEA